MAYDFQAAQQRKGRGQSVADVLKDVNNAVEEGKVDEVLIITISPQGRIRAGYSTDSVLYLLGAVEYMKPILLEALDDLQEGRD